ncbi:glutathione S-transferase family protein [Geopsychrobacter electrodiphilus]|uniref:glutathione S-transferase family protein n=1 Tax=Geopsychrobacter electrodiphilus TaxID=225196 RepID=UPI00035F9E47|nr:glutathione S-transferase family protein [Geopsychrobacter electrodiphilus]
MITLYGMPHTRSFRVLWALEEIGAEYEYQLVNLGKGDAKTPEFLALNPSGKLPVLKVDDLVLTESAAICSYLADAHPDKQLIPSVGTADRALYNQWCFFVLSELEQPLWTMGKHKFALPKEYRVREVQKTAGFEFMRAIRVLEKGILGRNFMVGEYFTMADLLVVHTLNWAQSLKIDHGSKLLDQYLDRVRQRPAWSRALAIDNARKSEMA